MSTPYAFAIPKAEAGIKTFEQLITEIDEAYPHAKSDAMREELRRKRQEIVDDQVFLAKLLELMANPR